MDNTITPSSVEEGLGQLRELAALRERVIPEITQKILDAAPSGVIISRKSGVIVLFSKQAETIFDYAEAEIIGKEVEMLLPERFREQHRGYRKRYNVQPQTRSMGGSGIKRIPLQGLTSKGEEIDLAISLGAIVHDGETLIITFVQAA